MLVHLIADYGHNDLAFAEVIQRLKRHLPDAEPVLTPVPPFATLAAGFCVAPYARLPTGVRVIGVNAGWAFSFVRDAAEELRRAAAPSEGSQFRSRDLFPQAAGAIALGRPEALADAMGPGDVADVPEARIAYVDGYGNIKTTIVSSRTSARSVRTCFRRTGSDLNSEGVMAFVAGRAGGRGASEPECLEVKA